MTTVETGRAFPVTATDAAAALRDGSMTSVDLTTEMIRRADELDSELGTYVTRLDGPALEAAAQADRDLAAGIDRGPLQGIPLGVKDILAVAEARTTANSLVLDRSWWAGQDAPVVTRLKSAGAVITGKTTTSEFACGAPDPEKPFAIPRNPWDVARSPAGSSAGTGNGVAAGLFLAGLGTDTGGSIRAPAAANGITGLKPTYGLVPKSGCVPMAYSMDNVGPMARSARDCAALLGVIAGYDASDETTFSAAPVDYTAALTGDLEGIRVGVDRVNADPTAGDPVLAALFEDALDALRGLGATVVDIELPYFAEARIASMATMFGETFAYHREDLIARWSDYGRATRMNLLFGAVVEGGDYIQAQRVRLLVQKESARLFQQVDLVVGPTNLTAAAVIDPTAVPLLGRLLTSTLTSYWNMTGQPALALPLGFNADGLPLSLQIAGRAREDALVLRAGDAYQQVTDWHLRVPPMTQNAF